MPCGELPTRRLARSRFWVLGARFTRLVQRPGGLPMLRRDQHWPSKTERAQADWRLRNRLEARGFGSRVLSRWPGLLGWRAAGWAAKRPLVLCMRLGRVRHGRRFSYLKRQAADLVDAGLYAGTQAQGRGSFSLLDSWVLGSRAWFKPAAFGGFDETSVDDRVATDPALGKAVASRRG